MNSNAINLFALFSKKKIIPLIIFLVFHFSGMTQTRVLTIPGGAIHCKISKVPMKEFRCIIRKIFTGIQEYSKIFYLNCLTEFYLSISGLETATT
ncbi:MAG: hypothetical protein PWQ54_667 [Bacteroidales bacterium]|jgi:hypothetical protein|nr:hypothetical protein [Bacteroidales bacterium]